MKNNKVLICLDAYTLKGLLGWAAGVWKNERGVAVSQGPYTVPVILTLRWFKASLFDDQTSTHLVRKEESTPSPL